MRSSCVLSLALALVAAPLLSAATLEQTSKPATPAAKSPAPAKAAAAGAPRVIEIIGTDDMKFSVTEIVAKRGEQLRVRLISKGVMPKIAMAHNFVQLKPGAKPIPFSEAAAQARATDFIPPGMKDQVLAATALAGPGETVEVTFKAPTAPGKSTYLCTFPGHFAAGMRGTLIVK